MNAFYIRIGTKVKWNNPDRKENENNNVYEVVDIINENAVVLENEDGDEVEAYVSELSIA